MNVATSDVSLSCFIPVCGLCDFLWWNIGPFEVGHLYTPNFSKSICSVEEMGTRTRIEMNETFLLVSVIGNTCLILLVWAEQPVICLY